MAKLSGHNRYVACCAFSRDGNLLATGNYSDMCIQKEYKSIFHKIVNASGSNDKSVIIWDLTGNLCLDSELSRTFASTTFTLTDHEKVDMKMIVRAIPGYDI